MMMISLMRMMIEITTTVKDDWWKRLAEVTNLIFSPFLKFQFSHQDHLFNLDFLFHSHQNSVKIKSHKIWFFALESTIVVLVNAAHVSQTKELLFVHFPAPCISVSSLFSICQALCRCAPPSPVWGEGQRKGSRPHSPADHHRQHHRQSTSSSW